MLKRQNRLRREYLYRKSQETKEKAMYDKKTLLNEAVYEGKPLSNQLKDDLKSLRKDLPYDEDMLGIIYNFN
jgi:U3 small nucleolar ribonucleoprotein protein IMP4